MTADEGLSRPDTWQAGDQVTRTYTRDEDGAWLGPDGLLYAYDQLIDAQFDRGHLAVSHLSPRAVETSGQKGGGDHV